MSDLAMSDLWSAPRMLTAPRATVVLPGSKSLTNRYLLLGALAEGGAVIHHPLRARDTELMFAALTSLGMEGAWEADTIRITGKPHHGGEIEVGLAGTVMRFLPPLAALCGESGFVGDPQASKRPMGALFDALRQLGVRVDAPGERLPARIFPPARAALGRRVEIDASASSQFVSALLLVGAAFPEGLEVVHTGSTLPSMPHIEMTIDVLAQAGVHVETAREAGNLCWRVAAGQVCLPEVDVEPDLTNAGPFLAAGALSSGSVCIARWPARTTQPGAAWVEILRKMGVQVSVDKRGACAHGMDGVPLHPICRDMHELGELVPTVAALALYADGTSKLRNIGHLRGHETDRLAALVAEIGRLGHSAHLEGGDLVVTPKALGQEKEALPEAIAETYEDHRMATFAAIAGLGQPVKVRNIATTAKTFPQFASMWEALCHGDNDVRADGAAVSAIPASREASAQEEM